MPSYYINPETTVLVVDFLKTKNDPVSIKKISREAGVTKRKAFAVAKNHPEICLLYTSPSPRDRQKSRMPSSA